VEISLSWMPGLLHRAKSKGRRPTSEIATLRISEGEVEDGIGFPSTGNRKINDYISKAFNRDELRLILERWFNQGDA
jgi:hypothetical protein